MTEQIHSCSYFCDRPACIKTQRDELRDRLQALNQYPASIDDVPPVVGDVDGGEV